MHCDCPDCTRSRRLRIWLDSDPGLWATALMFILAGLAAAWFLWV